MDSSFPVAHKRMLVYEGGYSNHPADPGGVTLNGVIQTVYDDWRRSRGLPTRALTKSMLGTPEWISERDAIYRQRYWNPPRCAKLEPGVDAAIYDYSVNSGIGRGAKVLQRLVGVKDDGNVGPETIEAANRRDAKALAAAICDERLAFLKRLRHWPTFKSGWSARVADVKTYTTAMATDVLLTAPPAPTEPSAKGEVPEPKAVKNIVKSSAPTAAAEEAARDGAGWGDWIAAHPVDTALIVVVVLVATALAIHAVNRWHRARQEAPTPGFGVVPEKA